MTLSKKKLKTKNELVKSIVMESRQGTKENYCTSHVREVTSPNSATIESTGFFTLIRRHFILDQEDTIRKKL